MFTPLNCATTGIKYESQNHITVLKSEMTNRIRIARPPVIVRQIHLRVQAEPKPVPRDVLQELSNRWGFKYLSVTFRSFRRYSIERDRRRMLDTLTGIGPVSRLDSNQYAASVHRLPDSIVFLTIVSISRYSSPLLLTSSCRLPRHTCAFFDDGNKLPINN